MELYMLWESRFHPPRKKHRASAVVESSMEGATLPTTRPTCSSTLSPSFRGSRCHVCTKMKMLSTPTASTKKGITCNKNKENKKSSYVSDIVKLQVIHNCFVVWCRTWLLQYCALYNSEIYYREMISHKFKSLAQLHVSFCSMSYYNMNDVS